MDALDRVGRGAFQPTDEDILRARLATTGVLVLRAWCLVPGAWCLVPGAWCLVPGAL